MERKYISSIFLNQEVDRRSYLYNLPIVRHLMQNAEIPFTNDITFFVGENGTGKSTLLEAIAVAYGFNAEGGSKNFNFSTSSTHSDLYKYLTISRSSIAKDGFFLRAESFYNFATNVDDLELFSSYGGKSLHEQSHGESFLALVQNRFEGNGIYILDEPEAALSPSRLLTLMAEINILIKKNSQFIIATHSPILMAFPNSQIYQLTESNIKLVPYQETEHYQLSKLFLDNPDQILRHLFNE
ncbi:AAA family ATPase [Sinanaerobacter sp. ZZT-01]|nr:AAA family ATPase [Sinanaerobacter sp. ZZT-01]WRR94513.1 AAA family ATPase [Sinanaerobacter sp. ZZT-01]